MAPPIIPFNREDTANHERRGATGACTEGRISIRTNVRTWATARMAAARMGERASKGRRGRQRANRQQSGASSPQQMVARIMSPAPQLRQASSQTGSSPRTPCTSQPRQGVLRSPTATRLGPPSTPTHPIERSRTPAGEPSPVETASSAPDLVDNAAGSA